MGKELLLEFDLNASEYYFFNLLINYSHTIDIQYFTIKLGITIHTTVLYIVLQYRI